MFRSHLWHFHLDNLTLLKHINSVDREKNRLGLLPGGVLLSISYIGMCGQKGFGFEAFWV